jgi:hypothetical protein
MRRRSLLAAVVAGSIGLAGCSGLSDGGDGTATDDGTPTDGPTTTPTGTDAATRTATGRSDATPTEPGGGTPDLPENRASVVDAGTVPRTFAFAPTTIRTDDGALVALEFDRTATADGPARLTGFLENRNEFENTFEVEWIPAVGRTSARQPEGYDHTAGLHLVPTENNDLAERTPSVARTDGGLWYAEDAGRSVPDTYRMAAGERARLEYLLVGERDAPGRPVGTYEFRGRDADARVTVWATDSPGPEAESRFAGRSVPAIGREGSTRWYHDADRTTRAFVRPAAERVELDGSVTFEAVNNSRETLRCGHWNLYKLVDGEWFHVAPVVHTSDCRGLVPGERKRWTLRAFNGEAVGCGGRECGCDGLTRGRLGGGVYGVVAGYGTPTDASGALVELVGDPVTLALSEGSTVDRDGTVTVTTPRYGDGERPPDATFTLRHADSADERVIAEQLAAGSTVGVTRSPGLRDALAVVTDDADRVVVRTDERDAGVAVGRDASRRRFRFRGRAYLVTRGSGGGPDSGG